jgi:hypothetical protein
VLNWDSLWITQRRPALAASLTIYQAPSRTVLTRTFDAFSLEPSWPAEFPCGSPALQNSATSSVGFNNTFHYSVKRGVLLSTAVAYFIPPRR